MPILRLLNHLNLKEQRNVVREKGRAPKSEANFMVASNIPKVAIMPQNPYDVSDIII